MVNAHLRPGCSAGETLLAPFATLRLRTTHRGHQGFRPAALRWRSGSGRRQLTTKGALDEAPFATALLDVPPSGLLGPEGPIPAPEGGVSRCGLRQRGPAFRSLSGRTPPGSRKNCHSTYGPPPFSGLARVADGGADREGRRAVAPPLAVDQSFGPGVAEVGGRGTSPDRDLVQARAWPERALSVVVGRRDERVRLAGTVDPDPGAFSWMLTSGWVDLPPGTSNGWGSGVRTVQTTVPGGVALPDPSEHPGAGSPLVTAAVAPTHLT